MPKIRRDHPNPDRYLVETVWRACDVLEVFQSESELLRLSDIAARVGLSRPTVFRLLHTLERRGFVERVGNHEFRLGIRPVRRKPYRLGYAGESMEFAFSRDVADSIARAAVQEGVDLLSLDNRYSSKAALRNVEIFIRERLDLVIEFQVDEHIAPVISSRLLAANIPLIAVEIPHPGATYYGGDNYGAGIIGGRHLGKWARTRWHGEIDGVILLELARAGALPNSRLTGVLAGLRETWPSFDEAKVVRLNGNGQFGQSLQAVRKHLRRARAERWLVAAMNDPSAVGAVRAFEEAGRLHSCAVVGHNASLEARVEMRRAGTSLVGSVGFFPERYGAGVMALAMDILRHKATPPAVFVKHQLVTPENVNHLYPNDALLSPGELDLTLLRSH
ncbi:MAG: helix-turn-helix domain-containing protein [Acidobacteria bacterium]|nr:helix-turn-helix domain-containing protein [Acidobacteriota bacterium]